MNASTAEKLKQALVRYQPSSVIVRLADNETRTLAPGGPRSKWTPIIDALDEYAWQSVELLDAKGRVLGKPIKNDGAAGELESLTVPTMPAGASSRVVDLAAVFALAGRHSERIIELNAEMVKPAMDAVGKTLAHSVSLAEQYREELDRVRKRLITKEAECDALASTVAKLASAKESNDDGGFASTLKDAAKVVPHLAPLLRYLLPAPAAKAVAAAVAPGPRAVP